MGTLHVRDVPDDLHERLRALAAEEGVSLSAEVSALLEGAVRDREVRRRQKRLLAAIRRHRFTPPKDAPDTVTLLREDRER